MEPSPPPPRLPWPALAAGLVALLAAALVVSDELGSMGGDSAEYVLLSKALWTGRGYVTTWAPGDPAPHTLYPPVWPLLLFAFSGAAPGSFLGGHLLLAVLSGAAVFVLTRLFERRGLPPLAAAAGALAPALSILWLRCAGDLLSEIPCLLFSALALLFLDPGREVSLPVHRVLPAAIFAGLAFLTRTAGLALLLPVAAALLLDPRASGRTGKIAGGSLLAIVAAWFAYGAIAGAGATSYGEQLGEEGPGFFARTWEGLAGTYVPGLPSFLFQQSGPAWDWAGRALWVFAAAGIVLGCVRRRGLAAPEAFFLLTLGMQSAWPFRDPRFALPMAALLVPFALEGALGLCRILMERLGRPEPPDLTTAEFAAALLALLLLVPNAWFWFDTLFPRAHRPRPAVASGIHEPAGFTDTWSWSDAQYAQAAPSLGAYLHACDRVRAGGEGIRSGPVLCSNPRVAALLCGRPAVKAPEGASPADLAALAREKGVALVLVDNFAGGGSPALRAWRDAGTGDLEKLFDLPGGVQVLRARR